MGIERNSHRCADCNRAALPGRTSHGAGEVLARHRHAEGFAAIVLTGYYVEAGDSGRHRVSAGDVIFHGAYENHLDRFGSSNVEVLILPIAPMWEGPVLAKVDDPDTVARLAERDPKEAFATLLATMTEGPRLVGDWPDLLAADLLNDPELSFRQWSRRERLHPGSLSRGFRQQFGITPVEFRSIARTRKAMRHLRQLPLSEAAVESGFADQPHMSRTVKRITGLSPMRLRESILHRTNLSPER